ncbi:hypothetical protein JTE90_017876 [Oedothorax gibbosus]|uniref:RNA polymerase II-associated protein 3 n=1 Tax=Oedothorax gibbosus TaxID=931172 RepID=A0AAV6V2L9_9ARAC|nr:hypothetical protein JTE90_017876 [Oedothorax gibbosus]
MEDSITLQNQIRENSEDLQTFLRDMDHWEKEMKQKEAELKLMNISEEQECPPIRNSTITRSKKRNRHKKNRDKPNNKVAKETTEVPNVRISAYNYKAWDKFDVDSELKKVDEEEKKESSSSESSEEEEEMSIQSKQQMAIIKKDNGNKFFKAGSYDSAINCYTIGMELDPDNALLPANRAMAFLKKDQYQAAENDCSLCLSLDPTYVKAYLRRGAARKGLKKLFLAKDDFLKALEIEPDNKQAQLELEKINKEISMESHSWKESDSKAIQDNILMEPSKSSIEIMEVQEDKDEILKASKDLTVGSYNQKLEELKAVKSDLDADSTAVQDSFNKLNLKNDSTANLSHANSGDNPCNGIESIISALEQTLPPVPTASFQFLTDWKKISNYPELKYSYLKQISPETIQKLFRHSIELELFPEILHTLSANFIENGDDVYPYLKALSTVGRFSMMVMFLSHEEKEDVKKLKSYLEISGCDSYEVTALMRLYGI